MGTPRVRFAPSPTGLLHLGSARTALFNYLFARSQGGEFLLRIEDTDRERSSPVFEREILDGLRWLGLHWDGEITRQSDRLPKYREGAESLTAKGKANWIEEQGKKAIVYKIPPRRVSFKDAVHGPIEFDMAAFEDLVILKSDGTPTYNFACVIDDLEMKITHVIRGDDHIANTPKQILLYEEFGGEVPTFAHLPLITGKGGAPLSKREGAVSLKDSEEEGYLPESLMNYLALLGWSPGGNQEFLTPQDLIAKFSLERVGSTPAMFDIEKLRWLNGEHLKALAEKDYVDRLRCYLQGHKLIPAEMSEETLAKIAVLFRERIKAFKDLTLLADYLLADEVQMNPDACRQHLAKEGVKEKLKAAVNELDSVDFSKSEAIEQAVRALAASLGCEARELIHPLRVALTGKTVSPGLFELMGVMGKDRVLKRIRSLLDHFEERMNV